MIHENAKLVYDICFQNGYRNQIWLSFNHNTGAPIVWQRVLSTKSKTWTKFKRSTGRNISAMVKELRELLASNIATITNAPHESIVNAFNACE